MCYCSTLHPSTAEHTTYICCTRTYGHVYESMSSYLGQHLVPLNLYLMMIQVYLQHYRNIWCGFANEIALR